MKPDSWIQDKKAGVRKACACSRQEFLLICHEGKLMGIGRACNARDFNAWISAVILCLQLHVQGAVLSIHVQRHSIVDTKNFASFTGFWLCNHIVQDTVQRKKLAFISGDAVCA